MPTNTQTIETHNVAVTIFPDRARVTRTGRVSLVPGIHSLQPRVLIYNPDSPKDDAPTLELATVPELKIVEAIRPTTLPPDVLEWLNPQQRLSYYFSADGASAALPGVQPPSH